MAESSPEDEIKPAAGAESAEERCPICLEDYEDKAFIDACFHAFCFGCIVKAVEVTTGRCPMCKATFDTVIHNVRAIDDYDRVSAVIVSLNAVSRVPASLCTNLYCHIQKGAGTRAT